jgi:hypothetical protein
VANAGDVKEIAMSLSGTTIVPHFDRTAFKVKRIYATLAADGLSLNLKFTPDEQEFKCLLAPDAFHRIDNAWGRQGWTTLTLSEVGRDELAAAFDTAWHHALPAKKQKF